MSSCDESAASDDRVVNVLRKRKKKREEGGVLGFMYRYFNFLNPNHKNKKKRGLSKVSLLGSVSSVGRALDSKKKTYFFSMTL